MSELFQVRLSPHAMQVRDELRRAAEEKPTGAKAAMLKVFERLCTDILCHRHHALSTQYKLRGDLSGVCRISSGRLRIFFLVSDEKKTSIVLFVAAGEYRRKAGDKNDAYREFARRVRRGEFDPQFAELDIPVPDL